ncbi:hypothetical protein SMG44B_10507 [Stenotrophomonas maltophilia]
MAAIGDSQIVFARIKPMSRYCCPDLLRCERSTRHVNCCGQICRC